jgi:hypothetical protein
MKITKKSLVLLLAIPLLASCGPKWESQSYKRVLSNKEKATLIAKAIALSVDKLNKVTYTESEISNSKLSKSTYTETEITTLFKKGEYLKKSSSSSKDEYAGGQTISNKVNSKESCVLFNEKDFKYALVQEEDFENTYWYNQFSSENQAKKVPAEFFSDLYDDIEDASVQAVENKQGEFSFIYSYENESFTPENYEGSAPKEVHYRLRRQAVASLNKDLTFKSYSFVFTQESNQDVDTEEITNKFNKYYEYKYEYQYSYGEKEASPSEFDAIRKDAKSGYTLYDFNLVATAFDKDGNNLGTNVVPVSTEKQLSFNKFHFVYNLIDIDSDVALYKFKVVGSSFSNSKDDPVEFDKDIKITTLNAGNSGITLSNGGIKMGEVDARGTLELDFETTSSGVTVNSVVANAYAHYE